MPRASAEVLQRTEALFRSTGAVAELTGLVVLTAWFVFTPVSELLANLTVTSALPLMLVPLCALTPRMLRRFGRARARRVARERLRAWMQEAAAHHHASVVELEPVVVPEFEERLRK